MNEILPRRVEIQPYLMIITTTELFEKLSDNVILITSGEYFW